MINVRVIEADLKAEKQLAQIIVRLDSDQVSLTKNSFNRK